MKKAKISECEIERYNRQLLIDRWGRKGQEKLKSAKVLVAGIGGLGCPASVYLTVAGIGTLVLVDNGIIEYSNLNRQILYCEHDIGRHKVDSAVEKLRQLNPNVDICGFNTEINERTATELIKNCDVVLDGTDNFETRFIINKACVNLGIPFLYAAIYGFEARMMAIIPGKSACLRCMFPFIPSHIHGSPALGATAGLIANLQVIQALKLITGLGYVAGDLIVLDGESLSFNVFKIQKDPLCSVCGNGTGN